MIDRKYWAYHLPVDALVKATAAIPPRRLPAIASWVHELTWRPAA